ncbi:MAG: TonB-dependent receptor [Prevotellaceae bacterium]|jgi:outer membrane receptor protein involved in Fe transport|nr:TonB-dependent receptor [Prevotellaceae bacterium]
MKFLCALALLAGVFSSALFAQSTNGKTKIQGVVLDESSGNPLEFATVLLRDTSGRPLQGETTNERGAFSLSAPSGELVFEASFVGYQAVQHKISVQEGRVVGMPDKIRLAPDSREMDAVVVSGARKPPIERKVDMLVMNVESIISAESSNALQLLKKAPGVSVDNDGNVTLNGQGVEIWIDGRPSQLSGEELAALLESTDGGNIDKIEIINSPSSKYDAAGSGGIINIKTKKAFAKGFNGNTSLGYRQHFESGFYFGSNGSLSLNYRTEETNTYLNYNARGGEGFGNLRQLLTQDSLSRYSYLPTEDNRFSQGAKLGFDYFMNKKNTFGFIANIGYRQSGEMDDGYTVSRFNKVWQDSSRTKSRSGQEFNNGSLNLNYTHVFDDDAQELTANQDYMRYASSPWQEQRTVYYMPYGTPAVPATAFKSTTDQTINIYSAKVDYTHPFGDKVKMETGAKFNQTATDNANVRWDSVGNTFSINTNETSDFVYTERIGALYANASWSIDSNWSVKGGLRYEYTYSGGDWKTANTSTAKRLGDIFPTLFVGYNISKSHNLGLSYTRRIQRPSYWQLNPFRRYIGPYSYAVGNPDLDPAYTDKFGLEYSAFHFINVSLGYRSTKGVVFQVPREVEGGKIEYTQENFGKNTGASLSISASQAPLAKWWVLDANIWLSYVTNQNGNEPAEGVFTGSFWVNNTFTLGKTIKAELSAWYQLPSQWGYFQTKSHGAADFSVKKTFWDDNASLSLGVDDIFNTNKFSFVTDVNGMRNDISNTWESRAVTLTFTYKFGNVAQGMRHRKVGDVEESSRVGGGSGTGVGGN